MYISSVNTIVIIPLKQVTVKLKKARGHKRRWNHIKNWRQDNLGLNLTDYLLNESDCCYVKIGVYPWNGLSLINSVTLEPKRKTKQKMLNGLLDIYEEWKRQLDNLGQPYYLKIWLFEPRFSHSQIVCAIADSIEFYENAFYIPERDKKIQLGNYGILKIRLSKLNWGYRLDEDHYDNTEVGEPDIYASEQDYNDSVKWFKKLLKKPHRTHKFRESVGEIIETYSFKRGELWVGGQK